MFANFVSIAMYAELAGITNQAVRTRIKNGKIEITTIGGFQLIDIEKYPPRPATIKGDK